MLRILKFGGSSLYDVNRIRNAVAIVNKQRKEAEVAVVVSALGGVTDELISLMGKVMRDDEGWKERFELFRKRHISTLEALEPEHAVEQVSNVHKLLDQLLTELSALSGQNGMTTQLSDNIVSFGERLSSNIFAAALIETGTRSSAFESQKLVRTNNRFGDADVDTITTIRQIRAALHPVNGTVPVITGFIGSTSNNEITTLGRSGSDYTASLVGEALNAGEVQIWTDVNGVLTADPDIVPTAVTISQLHYSEIAEMAHFGAKVLHPRTVLPLQAQNIPIHIKNTLNPDAKGTVITRDYQETPGRLRSVSVKKNIMAIALRSKGLDRIHELSFRALRALDRHGISVLFNTAASSDYGITVVVRVSDAVAGQSALKEEFAVEYETGLIDQPNVLGNVSMVTVIGEKLERDLGISGAVLSVLGENGIAPLAMAKGLANRHLSLLLPEKKTETAVRLLNDHFCIHPHRIRLFVAGMGAIGGKLLEQLHELKDPKVDFSIIGACNTDKMTWHPSGIAADKVSKRVREGQPTDLSFIVEHLIKEYPYRTVFVDATGDADVARKYPQLLKYGIHVVTPSKRANSFEQEFFDRLMEFTVNKRTHYLYETTVGAGLPVIQTIKDLKRSGDRILSISGVVSGTMTYLFAKLEEGIPFDEVVRSAKQSGISEPDPRDDLSGEDVVRKFMILARTAGFRVERDEIEVEDLISDHLKNLSPEEFFRRLHEENGFWKQKVKEARERDEVLRYTGYLEEGRIKIGIQSVSVKSPLGTLTDTNNQISIRTERYNENPLIIQGPGAGKEVTAAGVLADIQKVSRRLLK